MNDEFEIYKIKTRTQAEGRKTSDDFAVLPFSEYKQKILNEFGVDSKQYLIVSMYDQITCRDDFNLRIVQSNDQVLPDLNKYIIVPDSQADVTIIIQNYKTDSIYGIIEKKFTNELSALIRAYIKKTFKIRRRFIC